MNIYIYIAVILFIAARCSFKYHRSRTTQAVVLVVAAICLYESVLSICQLLGLSLSPSIYFAFTGSFMNPGPLGGLLSVCASILIAYYLFGDNTVIKNICLAVFLLAVIILPATGSRSANLALSVSLFLIALKTERGKRLFRKYWMPLLCVAVTVGIVLYIVKKPSADGRFFMNKISMRAMLDNGVLGAGSGHFSGTYGSEQADYFMSQTDPENGFPDLTSISEHERLTAECPDRAYNDFFRIGVEYGPIAMLLFVTVMVLSIVKSYKNTNVFCYGLVSFAVFACFSYPLNFAVFMFLLSVCLATCIPFVKADKLLSGSSYTIVAVACVCAILFHEIPEMRIDRTVRKECGRIMKKYNAGYYDYVVENSHKVFENEQDNVEFMYAYGRSLHMTGDYEKSDSILTLCTKMSCDPMIWNIMGNNSLALGHFSEAEEKYRYAFYLVPNRLYPLTLLAKLYHTEGDTVSFLDMAAKIETFKPKVESFHTEHLRREIMDIKAGYGVIND